jgi:hypothetical protein
MKTHRFAPLLLSLAVSLPAHAEDIRPGLWRITLSSRVDAAPGWHPEPFELTQCLDAEDAKNPDKLLAGVGTTGASGCDFSNRKYTGGHLSFDVSCPGTLGLRGHGEMDFSATRLDGTLEARFADTVMAESQIAMQNQLHAEYLGECGGMGGTGAAPFALPQMPGGQGGTMPTLPAPPAK